MSREIKFRAWNEEYKEFVYADFNEITFDKREFYIYFDVGFSSYPQVGWKFMQFTGLKDKNGKEIYEGDIIGHFQGEQAKPETMFEYYGVVRFGDGAFYIYTLGARFTKLYFHDIDGIGQINRVWHGHNGSPNIYETANDFKVVGNIYENPNLIK